MSAAGEEKKQAAEDQTEAGPEDNPSPLKSATAKTGGQNAVVWKRGGPGGRLRNAPKPSRKAAAAKSERKKRSRSRSRSKERPSVILPSSPFDMATPRKGYRGGLGGALLSAYKAKNEKGQVKRGRPKAKRGSEALPSKKKVRSGSVPVNSPKPSDEDLHKALEAAWREVDCLKSKVKKLNQILAQKDKSIYAAHGMITKFKNLNAELMRKQRSGEVHTEPMEVEAPQASMVGGLEPRVTAIEQELRDLKMALGKFRVKNPQPAPRIFVSKLISGLRNGTVQPSNLASHFPQTGNACKGRVGHRYMTKNIVECHKAMSSSFGIQNKPTQVDISDKNGNLLARGFVGYTCSDHGPILKIRPSDVYWENLRIRDPRGKSPFFLDFRSKANVRVYYQVRTVADQPFPPRSRNDNFNVRQPGGREGGYADYEPDYCYLDTRDVIINGKMLSESQHSRPSPAPPRPAINGFNIRPHHRGRGTGHQVNLQRPQVHGNAMTGRIPGLYRIHESGSVEQIMVEQNPWRLPKNPGPRNSEPKKIPNFRTGNFWDPLAEPRGGTKPFVHPERKHQIMY